METAGPRMKAATDERSANAALARAVETARRHRRTNAMLLGLALGVLLGLVYAPRSRWIVAEQARRAVSARASGFPATSTDLLSVPEPAFDLRLDRAFLDAAATRPDDAEVQTALTAFGISSAFGSASVDDVVDAFLPLLDRFPSTPESHAAALRLAAMGMARREPAMPRERWLWSLDHVIAIAKRGETLDPENGYFSAMRAAALYTAGRNGEARAALSDAASRPEWRDGIEFQVHGAWRLSDSAFGAANPVARAKMASTVDLSGYPLLRQAAGRAAAQALSAERAGRLADGYAIRHDLLVIGGRMRAGSSTLLGSLAGSAIQRGAMAGIGEAPPFSAYLRRAGQARDIPWVERQWKDQGTVQRVASRGLGRIEAADPLPRYDAWFALGQALFSGALWTALLALLASCANAFARTARTGHSRRAWERIGTALVPVLVAMLSLSAVIALIGPPSERSTALGRVVPALVLGAVVVSGRRVRRGFPALALPVACLLILAYGGVTLQTLRQSTAINRDLETMVQHEGRFYAGLAGLEWPE